MSVTNVLEEGATSPIAFSDSFWEIGQYKRTVRRIDEGLHLCHDLVSMVKERGEIEAFHAKQLNQWSKKWSDVIAKGAEYGTMVAAWRAFLEEADKKADIHLWMRDRLQQEVQNTIKMWSKEEYHKNAFGAIKESKDTDEMFRKAQKPWSKLYSKVDKCKKEYHAACRAERTAINQEKNAQSDTSISTDQTRKFAEKVEKCNEEVQRTKEIYQKALDEINLYNSKYMEDMCQVFERCQEMERKRLKFFKDMLLNAHKCVDISNDNSLKNIYENFNRTVQLADDDQDLKWWSQNHGVGMPMNWPEFEEYTPELRRIGKEQKSKEGITLVATKPCAEFERKISNRQIKGAHNVTNRPVVNGGTGKTADDSSTSSIAATNGNGDAMTSNDDATHLNSTATDANPFEDDWDATPERDGKDAAGVAVRALYDYEGQESDELSFKKGDKFDKLKDEDDQGWCTGRKDGRVGLYPANYVELVTS